MTEKYIDLAERIKRDRDIGPLTGLDRVTYTLRWLDRNPDQVPGRTITESELREAAGWLFARWSDLGVFMGHLQRELSDLGVTVVPDPEPTSAEKLEDDLGLTVEQRMRSWDDEAGEVRYVGRWEANE